MNPKCAADRRLSRPISVCLTILFTLAFAFFAQSAAAQTPATDAKPADAKADQQIYQTLYLTYATDQNSLNDILTDLRNILPRARFFGIASQNAISICGSQQDIATAQKVIADLDRPRKVYRLTYTITGADNTNPGGARHVSVIALLEGRTTASQGFRISGGNGPIGTTVSSEDSKVKYVNEGLFVGLTVEASLDGGADALRLHSRVEESRFMGEKVSGSASPPDVLRTVLDGTAALVPGMPIILGSLDIPGTTRREAVEVTAELMP